MKTTLLDPAKRRAYDRTGLDPDGKGGAGGPIQTWDDLIDGCTTENGFAVKRRRPERVRTANDVLLDAAGRLAAAVAVVAAAAAVWFAFFD